MTRDVRIGRRAYRLTSTWRWRAGVGIGFHWEPCGALRQDRDWPPLLMSKLWLRLLAWNVVVEHLQTWLKLPEHVVIGPSDE